MHIQRAPHPILEANFINSNIPLIDKDFDPFESEDFLADGFYSGTQHTDEQ